MTFNISDPSMEQSLKKIADEMVKMNNTLKSLITPDDLIEVTPEQLTDLTQRTDVAKAASEALDLAIKHNQ